MESQVREHQQQLRRRLESIKRIYKATDTLKDCIYELKAIEIEIKAQIDQLNQLSTHIRAELEFVPTSHMAAVAYVFVKGQT